MANTAKSWRSRGIQQKWALALFGQFVYLCSYAEHALKVDAHTSRDKLLNEAEDMESSVAWKELETERAKWVSMLPKNVNALLPWLLDQEAQLTASLFAFCVAASVDGISAADRAHPINALADLMQVDMPALLVADACKLLGPRLEGSDH